MRIRIRAACVAALLASAAGAQASRPVGGGWWDDVFADRTARLEDVLAAPEAFRGAVVRFTVQLKGLGRVDDAYHTKFVPETWLNFAAWSEDAPLWDDATFRAAHARFFLRRDHVEAAAVLDAKPYARFALRARVAETLRGTPWIEVLGATPLPGRMTEASLLRLTKATRLRDLRRYDAASEEFAAADDAELPPSVRGFALREAAAAAESAGRDARALEFLKRATAAAPEDRRNVEALAALRLRRRGKPEPAERTAAAATESTESPASAASRPASPAAPPAPPVRRRDDG